MRVQRRCLGVAGVVVAFGLTSLVTHAAAPLPLPPGPPAPREREAARRESCEPPCDYVTGANCIAVRANSLTVFPYDSETLVNLEAYAVACPSEWEGAGGCYESRIKKAVDELMGPSQAIADTALHASLLPDVAREQCQDLEPANAQRAVDETAAWCVTGRDECIESLREAHRVLSSMPAWAICVGRMEAWADENERRESKTDCDPTEPYAMPEPRAKERAPVVAPVATRPATAPPTESRGLLDPPAKVESPARRQQEPPVLEVVYAKPTPPHKRAPGRSEQPKSPTPPTPPNDPLLADQVASREPRFAPSSAPDTTTESSAVTQPGGIDDGRRGGQFELLFAPFSGVITLRDPGTGVEHRPMMASIGAGLDVVLDLSPAFGLELGFAARGSFASTALEQAVSLSLDQLNVQTGTAFVFELQPTVTLLSEYLGIGIVSDFRWDTVGITSANTGLVSTKSSGGAGGLRLLAGLGVLERDMSLVFTLDWMFIATQATALRAALQADIGPFVLVGSYRQHYRLGAATEAYVADDIQLTLGYRSVF